MNDIGNILQEAFMDGYRYRDAEIVRCKDCKYYYNKQEECPFAWKDLLNDDEYCSYGERRSE